MVALETAARNDVEDAVGAVADVGRVAAALDLDVVDVLGVDLRGEIAGDVGVGNLDAVDLPVELVAAAHVQHVVRHVGAGRVVGDHGHAVGAVRAGGFGDVLAIDQRGGRDAVDVCRGRETLHGDGLVDGANLQREVQHRRGIGGQRVGLLLGGEAGLGDRDAVVA